MKFKLTVEVFRDNDDPFNKDHLAIAEGIIVHPLDIKPLHPLAVKMSHLAKVVAQQIQADTLEP